jgi:ABC-type nitrate/sulfonate/bicarbonate transport system ATPase subunit
MMKMSYLEIDNLTVTYGRNIAVDRLSFAVEKEVVVLFGPSGCGKTSILKSILGVSERRVKTSGNIRLDGKTLTRDGGTIGMVFQGPVIPTWMKVFDLCCMGSRIRILAATEQRKRVVAMLERFGIGGLADRYPSQLSGGEKQRAALAITLLNEPDVLLLDEPTTFIDGMTRLAIWDFVEKEIRHLGIPVIIVSHDPIEAITLGDKIFVLTKPAQVKEVLEVPFSHPRSFKISQDQHFWELRSLLVDSAN